MRSLMVLLSFVATLLVPLLALCQTSPVDQFERGLRPHVKRQFISGDRGDVPMVRLFELNHVRYGATISQTAVALAPEWKPSMPLPIDLAKVESIARKELRKLVSDDSKWEVTEFHLQSFHGPLAKGWYFQVGLKPMEDHTLVASGQTSDSFWVCVDLAGEPGTVEAWKEK